MISNFDISVAHQLALVAAQLSFARILRTEILDVAVDSDNMLHFLVLLGFVALAVVALEEVPVVAPYLDVRLRQYFDR